MPRRDIEWAFHPAAALQDHAAIWDSLNDETHQSPVLSACFIEAALHHLGSPHLSLAIARRDAQPIALAIIDRSRRWRAQTFQPAQAPIGAWVQRAAEPCVPLANSLLAALGPSVLLLGISQQDPDLIARPEPGAAARVQALDYISTARITVRGSFEDYWAQRGSNLRQNLRKQRNRLARQNIVTRLEVVTDPAHVAAAVDDYAAMESAGWKGQEGTAVRADNAQGRFYRDLFASSARTGAAAVYRFFFNDRLVACDLCLTRGGTLVVLKTTHDESQTGYSPTMLMRQEMFAALFAQGSCRRIEFYGRLMEWHTRWSDEVRTMYHLNVWRWRWLQRASLRRRLARPHADAGEGAPEAGGPAAT